MMQLVLLAVHRCAHNIRDPEKIRSWASGVAVRIAYMYHRRLRVVNLISNSAVPAEEAEIQQDLTGRLHARVFMQRLASMRWTKQDQRIIRSFFLDGLPASEVAAELNKSENAIRMILRRIRRKVREIND